MSQIRCWCFTLNNYSKTEEMDLRSIQCGYIIIANEIGKEGTPHLQGYVEFKNRKRFATIAKINPRIHWEQRRGTAKAAIDYCKKDGVFIEIGNMLCQGKRSDLDRARTIARDEGMRGLVCVGSAQQISVGRSYLTYCEEQRDWMPKVHWYWGESGSGKSRAAREETRNEDTYYKNSTKWWNGYDGHETVVWDEFRMDRDFANAKYMLALLDRYPLEVDCKFGGRQMLARKIIFTCPFNPEWAWIESGESLRQFLRRITVIKKFVLQVHKSVGNTSATDNVRDQDAYVNS